ncbi:MAG: phytanoyl-CoA dioxygenase family protein [Gammaproteobacteria bacterium]|nr:phytanoyl-CoA dioxygenase family protein [Gammaproteobacteria bacterium]
MAVPSQSVSQNLRYPISEPPGLSLPLSPDVRRLTASEIDQYRTLGYVKNLPVFGPDAVGQLQAKFEELAALLPEGIDINQVNMWHKANRWVAAFCRNEAILDYVEDLIGPNFFQWGGQFFVKYPGDGSVVPWHQDSQYWPLSPNRTVTVWVAFHDADEGNGAMKVVRGSHLQGGFSHHTNSAEHYVLDQEVDDTQIKTQDVVSLDLKAGEVSLHDAWLLHSSAANNSDRVRCGFTMRFSPTDVKCDMDVWPTFEAYQRRGLDTHQHNPAGKVPTEDGFPVRKFQLASDFR